MKDYGMGDTMEYGLSGTEGNRRQGIEHGTGRMKVEVQKG